MAVALAQISMIYGLKGEIDQSIAKQNASLQLSRQIACERYEAIGLHRLSVLYMLKKDYATALGHSEGAERLTRRLGDDHLLASILHQQGLIFIDLASTVQSDEDHRTRVQTATERFQSSLKISRRLEDEAVAADTLVEIGELRLDAGRMQEAIAAFTEGLATYARLEIPAKTGIALGRLGLVHERQGEYEAALEKYQQALRVLQQYGSPQDQAIAERSIAQVEAKLRGAG
jgi:tetratricopeptide (TPR) repeat protein